MSNRCDLRKEAYRYIREKLCSTHVSSDAGWDITISLYELSLLREGTADPSAALVASLKRLFKGTVPETEIDAHLVAPFEEHEQEEQRT